MITLGPTGFRREGDDLYCEECGEWGHPTTGGIAYCVHRADGSVQPHVVDPRCECNGWQGNTRNSPSACGGNS